MIIVRRKLLEYLNPLFTDIKNLKVFCNYLNNDINQVIAGINKIIKYASVEYQFLSPNISLIYMLTDATDIEEKYQRYINKQNKSFLVRIKNQKLKQKEMPFFLDEDILKSDLIGLKIPNINVLRNLCETNLVNNEIEQYKQNKKTQLYNKLCGFKEVGLTYTRLEKVTIDDSFLYYHNSLTGNVDEDFYNLYNDERYKENPLNPLNNSYHTNLEQIRNNKNIALFKKGKVYEIENGRHRILYLLKHHKPVTIPVSLTKRIENREFNLILLELESQYDAYIAKNNLLNDNEDVIIVIGDILYELKTFDDLRCFYHNLKERLSNEKFKICSFIIKTDDFKKDTIDFYKKLILQKYQIYQEKLFTSDFTEILKYFEGYQDNYLYEAYIIMQKKYQKSIIYGYDLKTYLGLNYQEESTNNLEQRRR